MNLVEISNIFPTELDAVKHFENIRWGKDIICPYCYFPRDNKRRSLDERLRCDSCNKSYSVTVNTYLHNTRLPLRTWLMAFAIISDAKKGVSAMQLERNLGVHYETAYNMYHKIRELMALDNKTIDELEGIVEMDETYVGAKRPRLQNDGSRNEVKRTFPELERDINEKLKSYKKEGFNFKAKRGNPAKVDLAVQRGRGTKKIPVVGIVERDGNVIAEVMKNITGEKLKSMVQKYVNEDNSVLVTDEFKGYKKVDSIIERVKIDHQKLYSYKGVNTNSIESFWAFIKRQIMGQHHHVSPKHLPKYVAETVFKYNNRKHDDMFETLVINSMLTK